MDKSLTWLQRITPIPYIPMPHGTRRSKSVGERDEVAGIIGETMKIYVRDCMQVFMDSRVNLAVDTNGHSHPPLICFSSHCSSLEDLSARVAKFGTIITIKDNPHKHEQDPRYETSRDSGKLSADLLEAMQPNDIHGSPSSQKHIDQRLTRLADTFANNASTGASKDWYEPGRIYTAQYEDVVHLHIDVIPRAWEDNISEASKTHTADYKLWLDKGTSKSSDFVANLVTQGVVHQVLVPTLSDSRSSVFLGKLQTELTNRGVVIPEFKMTEAVVASGSTKNNRELQDDKKKADNEDTTYVKYPDVGVLCADRRSDLMGRAILDTMNQAVFEISNKKHTIVLPHGTCVLFDEHVPHGGWGGRDKDMVFEYKMKWTTQKTASFLNVSTPMVHELAKQHGWEICESSSNQDLWVIIPCKLRLFGYLAHAQSLFHGGDTLWPHEELASNKVTEIEYLETNSSVAEHFKMAFTLPEHCKNAGSTAGRADEARSRQWRISHAETHSARAALLTEFISEDDTTKIADTLLGIIQNGRIGKDSLNPVNSNHGDCLRLFGSSNNPKWKEATQPVMKALDERLGGQLKCDPPIVKAKSWMGGDKTVGFLLTLKGAADQECHLDHFEGPGASWIMPLGSTGDKLNFWGNVTKDVSS